MSSYKKLNDETFPTSLLMEFDELDDEFLISPPGLAATEKADVASGPRSPATTTSHTSNTSSGNYSLSTENENGSGSSSTSSHPTTAKFRTTTSKRVSASKDAKRALAGAKALAKSTPGQKRAKSMENLRNQSGGSGTSGHSLKRQPKYGHVKSKVKQFIDEAISQRGRHVLVRHKSMPESNNSRGTEEQSEIDQETDVESLRTMLREKTAENENLQRHLEFSEIQREDGVVKIETLKRKIEAMRLEESKRQAERDVERQRERDFRKELDRKTVFGAYFQYNRIFATTCTQTSPEPCTTFDMSTFGSEDSFERVIAASSSSQPNASTGPRAKRSLQYPVDQQEDPDDDDNVQDDISPDSATHPESSPDYPQLVPAVGRQQYPSTSNQPVVSVGRSDRQDVESDRICDECARKRKKKASKKARLASFFCIRKAD
ncbi:uncharacterized protein LOC120415227 isoform X1 [Culex pipiens pallens]|uniref:uncharacterized protein LOC120415227 isoform X1 n=1 Tax=Culex pipiens pallens TaxID=42434 RepID=UPI001954C717|nr:uncharacterized protein LOC120415227 isoform X1 [Culex pipiens pallens]